MISIVISVVRKTLKIAQRKRVQTLKEENQLIKARTQRMNLKWKHKTEAFWQRFVLSFNDQKVHAFRTGACTSAGYCAC